MDILETDFGHITVLDHRTVLLEPKDGADIDSSKAKQASEFYEPKMAGPFGVVVDRKADYSIDPIGVYGVFNQMSNLKAIAIVIHKERGFFPVEVEQKLFKGRLQVFRSKEAAYQWISQVLDEDTS